MEKEYVRMGVEKILGSANMQVKPDVVSISCKHQLEIVDGHTAKEIDMNSSNDC